MTGAAKLRMDADVTLPVRLAPPAADALKLAVVSDLHLGWDAAGSDLGFLPACLSDLGQMNDIDLLILNGDVNGRGLDTYPLVQRELLAKLKCHHYYLSGETEARTPETLQKYFAVSGRPLDAVLFLRGVRFVFLGTPVFGYEVPMDAERVRRLEGALAAQSATTLIFHHLPLEDTVCHSGDYLQRLPGSRPFNLRVPDTAAMRTTLDAAPEVKLWVSGHTRANHREIDPFGLGPVRRERHRLHLSVCNLGRERATPQGRFIFVEKNRILIRTRDFRRREWVDDLAYVMPGETTLSEA